MDKKIIVLTGATASSKTKISINLAKKIDAEIICADSRIVYKYLDIVSAKPTIEEQEGIVHHLIDIIEANCEFSAGDFVKIAKEKIKKIQSRNKRVIICGGSWFYIKSLLDEKSLIECPQNKNLRDELSNLEPDILWQKLNKLDSKRAALIHPNNKEKIIRSIEMCEFLSKPVSEFQRQDNEIQDAIWFMPYWDRDVLYNRINLRVDEMIDLGLYDEWKENKKRYPDSNILRNTIGYREFFDLENGIYSSFEEAKDKIKQHTRNFAKRQLTYFRSNQKIIQITEVNDILKHI